MKRMSRRDFLRTSAGTSAALLALGRLPGVLGQDSPTPTPLVLPEGAAGKLTVIHRTEYFEEVQNLFRQNVVQFAADRGIELDISTANPEMFGDFTAKMLAAVQAGNPPDLAYHTMSIPQLYGLNLVEDLSDVVAEAVRLYGEVVPITAQKNAMRDGKWWAVPFMSNTGAWFARRDLFEAAGIDVNSLNTWDERREAALAVSDPDNQVWGWGLTVNRSGDGHGFIINVIQGHGGSITDESGTIVTFNSPETVAGVQWLADTYTSDRYKPMLPPGVESWTDVSNNEAYLAGTVAFTANAFSVYANAKATGNPVFENTAVLNWPQALNGNRLEAGGNGWFTIFRGSQNIDVAKELILHMLNPQTFNPMVELGGGLFLPAYRDLWTDEIAATDPNFEVVEQIILNPVAYNGTSHPAEPNAAIDAVLAAAIPSQMMSNIINGEMSVEEAVKDAHDKIVQIFEEGGLMQG